MSVPERTSEVLRSLRAMIEGAKAVPMSASCMLNRAEALALVDQAVLGLDSDLDEARKVAQTSLETLERAEAEAAQIVAAAERRAAQLVERSFIMERASERAVTVRAEASEEAEALRREADKYVDSRIAAFEAALQKTVSQVTTMRARLAARSGLDAGETQALPRYRAES